VFFLTAQFPQKWLVSFKCVVKGYQECRFGVKEDEEFKVLKNIGENGRAFRVVNERVNLQ